MFWSRNKKNNVYPCKPKFYYIKVGFKVSTLYWHVFVMTLAFSDGQDVVKTESQNDGHAESTSSLKLRFARGCGGEGGAREGKRKG